MMFVCVVVFLLFGSVCICGDDCVWELFVFVLVSLCGLVLVCVVMFVCVVVFVYVVVVFVEVFV